MRVAPCEHDGVTAAGSSKVAEAPGSAHDAFDIAPGITYMDAATYGLPPRGTIAAIGEALDAWAAGTADWVEDWDRPAEGTRAAFAGLVRVPESSVALLPVVSVGVGLVASTLGAG